MSPGVWGCVVNTFFSFRPVLSIPTARAPSADSRFVFALQSRPLDGERPHEAGTGTCARAL